MRISFGGPRLLPIDPGAHTAAFNAELITTSLVLLVAVTQSSDGQVLCLCPARPCMSTRSSRRPRRSASLQQTRSHRRGTSTHTLRPPSPFSISIDYHHHFIKPSKLVGLLGGLRSFVFLELEGSPSRALQQRPGAPRFFARERRGLGRRHL